MCDEPAEEEKVEDKEIPYVEDLAVEFTNEAEILRSSDPGSDGDNVGIKVSDEEFEPEDDNKVGPLKINRGSGLRLDVDPNDHVKLADRDIYREWYTDSEEVDMRE